MKKLLAAIKERIVWGKFVRLTIFSYQACLGYPDITSIYTLPLEHPSATSCDTVTLRRLKYRTDLV